MAWTANVLTHVRATNIVTPFNGASVAINIDYPLSQAPVALANGTNAAEIDLAWSDQRSYNTSGTELDVSSLAAASSNGSQSASFTAVKYVQIYNGSSVDTIVVGNAAANCLNLGFSSNTVTFTVQPLGHICFFNPTAAGWATTTARALKIAASANTCTVTVSILGED